MLRINKPKLEYVDVEAPFTPLPKYGHLSKPTPEYVAAIDAIRAGYAAFAACPDYPSLRVLAGDADAPMPPNGPTRNEVMTELIEIPVRDGHMVELKVYKSPNVAQDAILMYRMHGGGWVVGRHEVDGAENTHAAINPGIVVVSVDYRLAPEHPFPQPLHDCYDGLLWCKKNAKTLGVNPERIIISGSSAGGNLAAALTLEARDNGISGVIAQVIHFPIICHPKFFPKEKYEFGSYIQNRDNPVLAATMMEQVLDAYIPDAEPDQRHSPLLAKSLERLPPTLIQCGGVDVLRDENLAYAEALKAAGVEVELHAYAGVPHCFPAVLNTIAETAEFYKRYNAFLKKLTTGNKGD